MTTTSNSEHHRRSAYGESDHQPRPRPVPPPVRRDARGEGGPDPAALLVGDRLALTVGEAGALLGISRALAYELVARGELTSIRLGRRVVVPKVALLELLGLRARPEA